MQLSAANYSAVCGVPDRELGSGLSMLEKQLFGFKCTVAFLFKASSILFAAISQCIKKIQPPLPVYFV